MTRYAFSEKSPQAFRTISEVAAEIDVAAHVLRFWEGKFSQIKPVKRGGGRRYYRPADIALLKAIRDLLYRDGLTIRGAQKVLREQGVRTISAPYIDESDTAIVMPFPDRDSARQEQLRDILARLEALRARIVG